MELPETGVSFFAAEAARLEVVDVDPILASDEIEPRLGFAPVNEPLVGLKLFLTGPVPVLEGARLSVEVVGFRTEGRELAVEDPMVEVRRAKVEVVVDAAVLVVPVLEGEAAVGLRGGAAEAPTVEVRDVAVFVAVEDVVEEEPTRGLGAAVEDDVEGGEGRFGAATLRALCPTISIQPSNPPWHSHFIFSIQ